VLLNADALAVVTAILGVLLAITVRWLLKVGTPRAD
jgi:hypothetical protein